jgi:exodeoxyribonuclease-3
MKIVTWNVNGIRARILNILEFIKVYEPEVLLLQEIKCELIKFPYFVFNSIGYDCEIYGQRGKNGVAILSKFLLEKTERGIGFDKKLKNESRYIESCFKYNGISLKVASIYVPNGNPSTSERAVGKKIDIFKTETFYKKLNFFNILRDKIAESIKNDELSFFCGDFNVCPDVSIDVWTSKKDGNIINTEIEREKFKSLLDIGMHDVWRDFNPNLQEYSWYSYKDKEEWEEKKRGYRIDAILCSSKTKEIVKKSYITKEIRRKDRASDHLPMIVEI